jgi:uncharacterized membrane protein YqaE (UPF0057 family)
MGLEHAPNHHTFFSIFATFVPPLLVLLQTSIGFDFSSERVLSMCTLVFPPLGFKFLLLVLEKKANCIGSNGLAMD